MGRNREQIVNHTLARALQRRSASWRVQAEQTGVLRAKRRVPDLTVEQAGRRTVLIETELEPARKVEEEARQRLGETLLATGERLEQVVSVRIPGELRTTKQASLEATLEKGWLDITLIGQTQEGIVEREPKEGWFRTDIEGLCACIEEAQRSKTEAERAAEAVEHAVIRGREAIQGCLKTHPDVGEELGILLHQEKGPQTWGMAIAILANAMAFQETLAGSHGIPPLARALDGGRTPKAESLDREWKRILKDVNYWPIFSIGRGILAALRERTSRVAVLRACMEAVETLQEAGALKTQEIMGTAFQRLISDRHVLKTHYTHPAAAALMAELVEERLQVPKGSEAPWIPVELDPACGTGALLAGRQRRTLARIRQSGADESAHHCTVLEKLKGLDVMPAAAHLTATQLSSAHPTVVYRRSGIATMPFGQDRDHAKLATGSLELLAGGRQWALFGGNEPREMKTREDDPEPGPTRVEVYDATCDVVVMNPPFTSNTAQGGNTDGVPTPIWAAFDQNPETQRLLGERLKVLHRKRRRLRTKVHRITDRKQVGDGNAGLATHFVDLAHEKLREGGTLATILPHTAVSGSAWEKVQALLRRDYRDVVVLSVAESGGVSRAFSYDTGMGECMVVATKATGSGTGSATMVNLAILPGTTLEGRLMGRGIAEALRSGQKKTVEWSPGRKMATLVRGPMGGGGAAKARNEALAETVGRLATKGVLSAPRTRVTRELPMTAMETLGRVGPVHRDIGWRDKGQPRRASVRGPFRVVPSEEGEMATYPVLWGHDAKRETRLTVEPDCEGEVENDRDKADAVWEAHAGTVHLNTDFRLNSQPLAACITPEPCLGGRAWPVAQVPHPEATVLWENTTPGLLLRWWGGNLGQEGRTSSGVSKLRAHRTLDTRTLSAKQHEEILELWEKAQEWEFLPAHQAAEDGARRRLDEAMLTEILKVDAKLVQQWRETTVGQWCTEPSVHGGKAEQGSKRRNKAARIRVDEHRQEAAR